MYSTQSVGTRMEPWGSPALTGHSCENFPSRTTRRHLLLRKEEVRPNISPEIPQDLSLWRRPACQTLSKALEILLDTTVRRSAVDREDLKPYRKSEKRPHFSRWSKILLFTSFLKTLLTKERRLTGR